MNILAKSYLNKKNYFYFIIFIFTIFSRFSSLNNPLIDVDEGFYLFTGGQLLHGYFPFVDIWDRKPFGLFLIYAFFHLFGPYRIIAYQVGATLCVILTAIFIMKMARTIASSTGALISSLLYVSYLNIAGGEGGQSPVFYNLIVCAALYILLKYIVNDKYNTRNFCHTAYKVMFLFGIALQIKYTTVFEGVFSGCFLISILYKKTRSIEKVITQSLVWILIALLPTVSVAVFYFAVGYGHEWWFANINSIFHRGHRPPEIVRHQAIKLSLMVIPLVISIPFRHFFSPKVSKCQKSCSLFLNLWACSALLGVIVFGSWYTHYALPLFPPLCIACAPLWSKNLGKVWLSLLLCYSTIKGQVTVAKHQRTRGDNTLFHTVLRTMNSQKGCLFIYSGSPIFYDFYNFCHLTTRPFPGHFHELIEQDATGMQPEKEITRILAALPLYIMSREPALAGENTDVRRILYQKLNTDYHLVFTAPQGDTSLTLYQLNTPAASIH